MIKRVKLFVTLMLLGAACLDDPECFQLNNNIVGFSFKKVSDGSASAVVFTSIKAIGSETLFTASANKVYLPLNYFTDTTSFVFAQETRTDTVKLKYSARAQYVSPECGERYVLSGLDTMRQTFDSVRLITRDPARVPSVNNIEVYFEE